MQLIIKAALNDEKDESEAQFKSLTISIAGKGNNNFSWDSNGWGDVARFRKCSNTALYVRHLKLSSPLQCQK